MSPGSVSGWRWGQDDSILPDGWAWGPSEFIKTLNISPDPGVPYRESADQLVARLIAKVGRGILFDLLYQNAGHDIAVQDDSIRGIADNRTPPPKKCNVICHHLNYFVSEAGLKAMASVSW